MQYFIYRYRIHIFIILVVIITGVRIWYDISKQTKPQTVQCTQLRQVDHNTVQCLQSATK